MTTRTTVHVSYSHNESHPDRGWGMAKVRVGFSSSSSSWNDSFTNRVESIGKYGTSISSRL